jgi:hypothetical protein
MPIAKYNRQFGGKRGAAAEAMAAMQDQYGGEKGEGVFYALKNKRKKAGWKPRPKAPAGR